jgi:ERCC4-type nuclease
MEENDFKRIEQLVSSVVDAKLGQQRKEINEDFRHHVGILTEDFQHKLRETRFENCQGSTGC